MIAVSTKYVQKIQLEHRNSLKKQWQNAKEKLSKLSPHVFQEDEKEYLHKVIELFDRSPDILTTTPEDLIDLMKEMGNVPENEILVKGKAVMQTSPIKEQILIALNYKALRTSFYPKYFSRIGIKTCVYCNSQLAISINKNGTGFSGRFDVDHYHSKHRFPWMSICLFNLYPACAPCNRRKSNNAVEFALYSDDAKRLDKSNFSFKLDPYAKAKFLISKETDKLSCSFKEDVPPRGKRKFEDVFHIKSIYDTQKDVMEELLIKSQIYDSTYKNVLKDNLIKLGISETSIERIILGNYFVDEDIHKRPLSKFMQDLAIQLELISY